MDTVSEPKGVTGELVEWIDGLELTSVPHEIKTRLKHLILDGIACSLVGARLPWTERAAKTIFAVESEGACTIIGWNKKLGPLAAAILNSSMIQAFELDDWHSVAPCHIAAIVLPALFAAAEQGKATLSTVCTGADFLLAALVGYEVSPRVGKAIYGGELLARGIHSGAVMGHAGAAAASAKLLRLPRRQIEHTIGTGCTQACGLMSAQYGSEVKRMQHGFAARNGLFAAFLSRGGYTGIEQVFERPYGGFLSVWGNQKRDPPFDASVITKDLGRDWVLRDFCIKPYAAMAGLHPLADCIIELRQRCPDRLASLDKIKNVHMTFSDAIYGHGGFDCPPPPLAATTAQMCGKYVAAAVLLDGDFHMRQLSAACIDRPELFDLVERISTAHDPAFDAEGMLTSTRVVVTFTDGHVEEVYRRAAHGLDPPLTNAEIVDKFRTFCESVGVSPKRRDAIERLVLGLEDVADVAELVDLLSPEVKNPIA